MKIYIGLLFIFLFSSCIKQGLDELPVFKEADISKFSFEYRWYDEENGPIGKLMVVDLKTKATIDTVAQTVSCEITVPAANENKGFPAAEWEKVSLENLVGFCDISVAATIISIGESPALGVVGNYSGNDIQYKVTAADLQTTKDWTIIITDFVK